MPSRDARESATGAWIQSLVERDAAGKMGYAKPRLGKGTEISRSDPACLGEFRARIDTPDFGSMLAARANR
jgi:hypothetical protein